MYVGKLHLCLCRHYHCHYTQTLTASASLPYRTINVIRECICPCFCKECLYFSNYFGCSNISLLRYRCRAVNLKDSAVCVYILHYPIHTYIRNRCGIPGSMEFVFILNHIAECLTLDCVANIFQYCHVLFQVMVV